MGEKTMNRKDASKKKRNVVALPGKPKSVQFAGQLPTGSLDLSKNEEFQGFKELEAIFKTAPVGLCVFDQDLRYIKINDYLAEINGLSAEEHIGKTVQEVIPDLADKAENIAEQIFRTGKPILDIEFSGTMSAEPNVKLWLNQQWLPLKNEKGQIIGISVAVEDVTKQRQAEESLREINQTLEERVQERTSELNNIIKELKKTKSYLLQAHRIADLGIWEWNILDNQIVWSDEVYRIFGIEHEKPADLTFEYFLSFVHSDDVDFVKQSIDKSLNSKQIYFIEHRIIRPDGNERIVKQRAEAVYNAADNPIRMVGTIQNITEDKRKEDRLHEQALEVKSKAELIDLAHDMIVVHDLDGKIIFWNQGAEKTYGWKREEVLGKITHDLLKTKFSEPLLKITASVSTNGNWEGELIQTTKDGRKITVESKWAIQKDEDGKASAILESDRDITKRKSAEKKTQEARKYAESIIATIQEALVVLDSELKVLRANDTFYKLFSLEPENTEGKFIYKVGQNQWDIPELRKLLEDVLPKNTSFEEYEMEYAPKKESGKILLLNARRIYRDKKRTEMILLAIQDITARKQQEKRLGELTEELLLAEEQQRQQVAVALHDSIGQMLAFSKRELASLLKEPNLTTNRSLKKVLDSISKALKQSRELTADLSSPTLHTFGLEAGLEELVEQFSKDNGLKCSFNTTEESKALEKKVELLLYRCAKELLCNIAKHSRAKNVAIGIKSIDNFLELTVTDDGKGFDTSRLDKDKTRKKSFGLFSIQQRLTNVGGSFNIESEKKKGTKVILRAPLSTAKNKKGK